MDNIRQLDKEKMRRMFKGYREQFDRSIWSVHYKSEYGAPFPLYEKYDEIEDCFIRKCRTKKEAVLKYFELTMRRGFLNAYDIKIFKRDEDYTEKLLNYLEEENDDD